MNQPKVIIIGAGIGGLATAIQLARHNYHITILEKNSGPGGRCGQIVKNGHHFDIGPTFFIFPQIYQQIFEKFGENIEDHLQLLRVNPAQQICFEDNSKILLTSDMERMRKQLEKFENGSFERFKKFLEKAGVMHHQSLEKIIMKDFRSFYDFFNISNILFLLKTNAAQNHFTYMNKFFADPRLKNAFTFQDSYIGLNPYSSPSIYSLFAYSEYSYGVWYPKGGMNQVARALYNIAKKYKINIIFNSPVTKINSYDDKVTSVNTLNGSTYPADIIVANSDLSYVYQHLLPKSDFGEKLKQKKYSCSTITFFWGMKKQYPELKTHNLFLAETFEKSYEQVINKHTIPDNPHFYLHSPAKIDPSMAPNGQDTVTAIVPIGHITPQSKSWKMEVKKVRNYVLKRLENFGLKDFKKNIKFEITITPPDWQNKYNLTNGSTLGLHHNITQMGWFRPKRRHTKYKNLFFVGSNTHPGSGVPTVLLSAYFTTNQIVNLKNKI